MEAVFFMCYNWLEHCGKAWYTCGVVTLPLTIILMLLVINKNINCVSIAGLIFLGVQLILLIGSIFPTEIALRKTFDKNGERR